MTNNGYYPKKLIYLGDNTENRKAILVSVPNEFTDAVLETIELGATAFEDKQRSTKGNLMRDIKFRIWDGVKNEWLASSNKDALPYYGFALVGEVMTVQSPPIWSLDEGNIVE